MSQERRKRKTAVPADYLDLLRLLRKHHHPPSEVHVHEHPHKGTPEGAFTVYLKDKQLLERLGIEAEYRGQAVEEYGRFHAFLLMPTLREDRRLCSGCGHERNDHTRLRGVCFVCYAASDSGARPYCARFQVRGPRKESA